MIGICDFYFNGSVKIVMIDIEMYIEKHRKEIKIFACLLEDLMFIKLIFQQCG